MPGIAGTLCATDEPAADAWNWAAKAPIQTASVMIAQWRIARVYAKILGVSAVCAAKFPSSVNSAAPTASHSRRS